MGKVTIDTTTINDTIYFLGGTTDNPILNGLGVNIDFTLNIAMEPIGIMTPEAQQNQRGYEIAFQEINYETPNILPNF